MSVDKMLAKIDELAEEKTVVANDVAALEGEVEELNARPDHIPADVWDLIQDNGRLATERLNELLASPRFSRLRAGDQAKLIKLAQDRAYGTPVSRGTQDLKRKAGRFDVTQAELDELVNRGTLPEYKQIGKIVDDAEEL